MVRRVISWPVSMVRFPFVRISTRFSLDAIFRTALSLPVPVLRLLTRLLNFSVCGRTVFRPLVLSLFALLVMLRSTLSSVLVTILGLFVILILASSSTFSPSTRVCLVVLDLVLCGSIVTGRMSMRPVMASVSRVVRFFRPLGSTIVDSKPFVLFFAFVSVFLGLLLLTLVVVTLLLSVFYLGRFVLSLP